MAHNRLDRSQADVLHGAKERGEAVTQVVPHEATAALQPQAPRERSFLSLRSEDPIALVTVDCLPTPMLQSFSQRRVHGNLGQADLRLACGDFALRPTALDVDQVRAPIQIMPLQGKASSAQPRGSDKQRSGPLQQLVVGIEFGEDHDHLPGRYDNGFVRRLGFRTRKQKNRIRRPSFCVDCHRKRLADWYSEVLVQVGLSEVRPLSVSR